MPARQTLPHLWLISDVRNDAGLEDSLRNLPPGSGFIFRHYHLPPAERMARFRRLARIARARGGVIILAGRVLKGAEWGANGAYGAVRSLQPRRGQLRLATVHNLREIGEANRLGADAVLLSPVFPTRSHPGGATLGPLRFRLLAQRAKVPVIALGGMDPRKAKRLQWECWAAIDGLSRVFRIPANS